MKPEIKKIERKLEYIKNYLGWAISILAGLLGTIFLLVAGSSIIGYLYAIGFLLIALGICPKTPFPFWIKALIALAFVVLMA